MPTTRRGTNSYSNTFKVKGWTVTDKFNSKSRANLIKSSLEHYIPDASISVIFTNESMGVGVIDVNNTLESIDEIKSTIEKLEDIKLIQNN